MTSTTSSGTRTATADGAQGRQAMAESMAGDGRISFWIRIGVTGHRELHEPAKLAAVVREQFHRIHELLDASHTDVRLAVVSQLAEGADRLVVEQVLAETDERGERAQLEVMLPAEPATYARTQGFSPVSQDQFDRLVKRATSVATVPAEASATDAEESWAPTRRRAASSSVGVTCS